MESERTKSIEVELNKELILFIAHRWAGRKEKMYVANHICWTLHALKREADRKGIKYIFQEETMWFTSKLIFPEENKKLKRFIRWSIRHANKEYLKFSGSGLEKNRQIMRAGWSRRLPINIIDLALPSEGGLI